MSGPHQVFAPLAPAVEAALRASIRRFGVIVPVVRDQHGNTIDGHHRSRIAEELGVEYKVDSREVADDDEAKALARTLNADRRHLTEEQRREVVALLAAETVTVVTGAGKEEEVAKHSPEAIAGALGVTAPTVRADIAQLETTSKLARPAKALGQDGKVRPTRREPRARNRRPLPELTDKRAAELLAAVEAFARLRDDDRWNEYAQKISPLTRENLLRAMKLLTAVAVALTPGEEA